MNIDAKIFNKIWKAKLDNTLKGSYIINKWDLYQGCKDGFISANKSM